MHISGIICEYNPLHLGHQKQIRYLKEQGKRVVCLMSGNFVQRGHPAIIDKMTRAQAALECGADLVLELPLPYCLSSAEGFAAGGVNILSRICDELCFGAENADPNALMDAAKLLVSDAFQEALRRHLATGCSFPAARAAAAKEFHISEALLSSPNNILGVEYCKAILTQESPMVPHPILREGSYHDVLPDPENPSATALRSLMEAGKDWHNYIPKEAKDSFDRALIHTLAQGEKAILYRLRTMTDAEFEALPFGSEGLWRKLMHAARSKTTIDEIITATKSKRYTRTRIDRMILCAYLGLTDEMRTAPVPYCRVLGFNDNGRQILSKAKDSGFFVNIGERTKHEYEKLEYRAGSLYALMAESVDHPQIAENYRVIYKK